MKIATFTLGAALTLAAAGGVGDNYLNEQQAITETAVSPLENARQSSFDLMFPGYNTAGSAVLIGRTVSENGEYHYRALTAFHVAEDLIDDLIKYKSTDKNIDRSAVMTFQIDFHGEALKIRVDIGDINWALPSEDWAVFTFVTSHKLPCVEIATRDEFKKIQPFEKIYIVAAQGPYGQQCREAVIAATHNVAPVPGQKTSPYVWDQSPKKFFRISCKVWYGDSGGPIFNQAGKLIGIINGMDRSKSGVALKTHLVRELIPSEDLLIAKDE